MPTQRPYQQNYPKNQAWISAKGFGELIKIRLTEQEKIESENYEDFEEFISTLEEKYCFRLSDCNWMSCDVLSERSY